MLKEPKLSHSIIPGVSLADCWSNKYHLTSFLTSPFPVNKYLSCVTTMSCVSFVCPIDILPSQHNWSLTIPDTNHLSQHLHYLTYPWSFFLPGIFLYNYVQLLVSVALGLGLEVLDLHLLHHRDRRWHFGDQRDGVRYIISGWSWSWRNGAMLWRRLLCDFHQQTVKL